MPNPELAAFGPNQLEQQYERDKASRLMPEVIGAGGSYWLRTRRGDGESFSFTENCVEITQLGKGSHYYSFNGLLHHFDTEKDKEYMRGLVTLDGIVVGIEFETADDGRPVRIEVERGYFLGEITPGRSPDNQFGQSLELVK